MRHNFLSLLLGTAGLTGMLIAAMALGLLPAPRPTEEGERLRCTVDVILLAAAVTVGLTWSLLNWMNQGGSGRQPRVSPAAVAAAAPGVGDGDGSPAACSSALDGTGCHA